MHLKEFEERLRSLGLKLELYNPPFLFRVFLAGLPELFADFWVLHPDGDQYLTSMPEYRGRGHFVYRLPAQGLDCFQEVEMVGCRVLAPLYIDALLMLAYGNWRKPEPGFHDYQMPCAELLDHPPEVATWPKL